VGEINGRFGQHNRRAQELGQDGAHIGIDRLGGLPGLVGELLDEVNRALSVVDRGPDKRGAGIQCVAGVALPVIQEEPTVDDGGGHLRVQDRHEVVAYRPRRRRAGRRLVRVVVRLE
jgi:hypothetical protein